MSDQSGSNSKESTVNSQITDSITAMRDALNFAKTGDIEVIGQQVMVQAAGLAMLNAVQQQHQQYILQNTVTTVAVKAMLENDPQEAIKLMNETIQNNSIVETLNGLKSFIDEFSTSIKKEDNSSVMSGKSTE